MSVINKSDDLLLVINQKIPIIDSIRLQVEEVISVNTLGAKLIQSWQAMAVGILLVLFMALTACGATPPTPTAAATAAPVEKPGPITIKITNPNIETAIARILDTKEIDTLDGRLLTFKACSDTQAISVWSPGYYVETLRCNGNPKQEYPVTLRPLDFLDNPNYAWVDADPRSNRALNCAACHADPSSGSNEHGEWDADGHATVFEQPYFLTMYLAADPFQTLASADGLGFQPEYAGRTGQCMFCHAPAALPLLQRGISWPTANTLQPGERTNVETEGVTCDVCHKVSDVLLGENELPFEDKPGVLSLTFQRPSSNAVFYFGPRPDHKPGISGAADHMAACSPVFSESRFCAVCHYGKFYDAVIYNSYGEWLDSKYSKKTINSVENQEYRACQDCHMISAQSVDGSSLDARSACSQENLSFRDFSHNMMKRDNTGSPILVQGAATVSVTARKDEGKIKVKVTVANKRAGHKLPTDSPLRHLILVVEARDTNGKLLAQLEGPSIPDWGGADDQPGGYAGQPGVIYANILMDTETGAIPAVEYWNPTVPAWSGSDTRLPPLKDVPSNYSFLAPYRGEVTVTARLFYRYAFLDLILQNGWPLQDVLVNWDSKTVSP
jgi:hypothetical protein